MGTPWLRPIHLGVVALAACGRGPGASAAAPRIVAVDLVGAVPYESDLASGVLWRVAVRTTAGVDTLPGVLAADAPVRLGDSALVGVRSVDDRAVGLYAYDARTRRVRPLPTPAGWVEAAAPQLAPDGRHVAYLAEERPGRSFGAVAAVPSAALVYRGPSVASRETDAGIDVIRWTDASHFEIRIDMSYEARGTHRVRGTVAPAAAVIDTVPADTVPPDAAP